MREKKRFCYYLLFFNLLFFTNLVAFAQDAIRGTLRTTTGEPIVGATVMVKGTNITAVSDASGQFTIAAPMGSTLTITSVGFQSREIAVNSTIVNEVLEIEAR